MIIVTGGAGFIGSNILAALDSEEVVAVDWLGSENKWKNIAKRNLFDVVPPENLTDFLSRYVNRISAIIHMGAISTTTERDADLFVRSNIRLTWDLWEFCRDFGKQLIFASSAATYGDGENGFDDDASADYLNRLRPLNPYGWSKAFIDRKIASVLAAGGGTPKQFVGLKFFNVYGPNEYHKGDQKSVVAHIFPRVKSNDDVCLFKSYRADCPDGCQRRDFVWVGDIVEVIGWFLAHPEISGLFNVGSGQARTFNDLACAVWSAMEREPKIRYIEMPENLRAQYQYYTKANLDKLRAAGYDKPMTALEDGVGIYVRDYLNQADPYR